MDRFLVIVAVWFSIGVGYTFGLAVADRKHDADHESVISDAYGNGHADGWNDHGLAVTLTAEQFNCPPGRHASPDDPGDFDCGGWSAPSNDATGGGGPRLNRD